MSIKTALFTIYCLLMSSMAVAAEPLTDTQVLNYIKSGPEFKQWSIKNQVTLKAAYQKTKLASPADVSGEELMQRSMTASGLKAELDALVKPFGFNGGMQYLGISQRIMRALMAQRMEANGGASLEAEKRMQEALKRLEKTSMSAEQKAQMQQMIKSRHGQMAMLMKAPKADMDVVEPHMVAIQQAFGMK